MSFRTAARLSRTLPLLRGCAPARRWVTSGSTGAKSSGGDMYWAVGSLVVSTPLLIFALNKSDGSHASHSSAVAHAPPAHEADGQPAAEVTTKDEPEDAEQLSVDKALFSDAPPFAADDTEGSTRSPAPDTQETERDNLSESTTDGPSTDQVQASVEQAEKADAPLIAESEEGKE